jgi:hypothetical protein
MGGKRKKVKEILSPTSNPSLPATTVEDDELLDDLIAQLDSNDKTVQDVSAEVINDIQLSQLQENKEPQKKKKDSKRRFLERQVCIFLVVKKTETTTTSLRHGKPQILPNTTPQIILRWMPR